MARWGSLLGLAAILSGCGSLGPSALPATPTTAPLPTELVSGGVPQQLTDLELAVGSLGETSYSGYSCVIAPAGCACETPVIQSALFTFTPDNRLLYAFEPVGAARVEWQLDHAGVNQWSYAAPLRDSSGNTQALLLALLSFTTDGYILTQVTTMSTGETVDCPDVIFHRLPK